MDKPISAASASVAASVCLVAESYFPNLDGGAVFAKSLAENLQRRGHNVRVITWRDFASYCKHEIIGGVSVTRVAPTRRWGILGRYFSMLTVALELLHRHRTYEVILVPSLRILGLPGVVTARLLNKKCILRADSCGELSGMYVQTLHGPHAVRDMFASLYFRVRNMMLKQADAFVCISSAIRSEFVEVGIPPERIHTIANGIDLTRFSPVSSQRKAALRQAISLPIASLIFAYSGRLTREKGLQFLLRAWLKVHKAFPHAHLLLVGSGKDMPLSCEEDLRRFVAENHLTSSVTFAGAVDKVQEFLQCADVFVLLSDTEALGLALIEAIACGLPAIATRVGGIPDVVIDGVNGILIEPGKEDAFVVAASELILNEARRMEMGRSGRQIAVSEFSSEEVTNAYIRLLCVENADRNFASPHQ